ncbi:bifunctional proline dehydrogenase/L-glutamate gamma-semialdehyde dehydrogenase PutA [Sandaracinobacteroides saxicola]|uniref:Bifunctional protein PutA n=2 Tax=Sandaracinobacteroides saxicola TaxID=2759707 RepID=A0A7G5IME6_9SPHN|nr:bifunctional proline dehydrogenase/L-glutamate gamma-semialdehyde dehydrogenase PutA [Sandaracinobacteroides saxicola]
MRELYRAPEPDVLAALLPDAMLDAPTRKAVLVRAGGLLADLRAAAVDGWVNRFLQQYRLNTEEGIALLSLAEAFLRVPDADTADALIRDKLGMANWAEHSGQSDSALVNSATWGLVITRALVKEGEGGGVLGRLVARAGEPFVRTAVGAAMRVMAQLFVMGRNIAEALERMEAKENRGFNASFDMLGEAARTAEDAERYFAAYGHAVAAVGKAGNRAAHSVSVKLSALHPRYETARAGACVPALTDMLRTLARAAAAANVGLTVDAEESERLVMSLEIIAGVADDPALRGWDGLGMAVQAYGKRAAAVVDWAAETARQSGRRMTVRLVKGAYWDSEIKRTQEAGLSDYPLFTRKAATDVSYLACARRMLAADSLFPAFASHNALTVATILQWAGGRRDFEFQRLHGMGAGLYERLVAEEGYACRLYAPVGGHRDLLAYLVRRLLENGANSSFVHQLADRSLSDAELLADPAAKIAGVGGARHPAIPLPADLFPGRRNSAGLDLAEADTLAATVAAVRAAGPVHAVPLTRGVVAGQGRLVVNPARPEETVGSVVEADAALVARAVEAAARAAPGWDATPVEARARMLEAWGDAIEADRDGLLALLVKEAGKTLGDAVADLREAVDFCRYYAVRARLDFAEVALPGPTGEANSLRLAGRGVYAAIAPWNFPLAIFVGQVAAALVAGNAVLAKPAPQTPLVAFRAVQLAHEAGVPADVLHFLPGGGEVGGRIVADARVAGVVFTGSTATARTIARALLADDARPLVPLIAETGGINAMIVDSTALPEQVVADVVTSAFRSAGQRCSALRLLCVQAEVSEGIIAMLKGAMDLLRVGDPADPATDVGPVIDAAAAAKLNAYRERMRGRWLHSLAVPEVGHFVAPTLIGIDAVDALDAEWFGPLLHVCAWRAGELEALVTRLNAKGYGLTMGLHSRIAGVADRVRAAAKVGNLYVNRSMIGAVVGAQPFGGEGLSGTGPKAGGPHYLPRFAVERTVSVDTTSAGGNASLLSIED